MFYIEDDVMFLTKGDYGALALDLKDGEGEPYAMQEGDTVTLTIRAEPTSESPVIAQVSAVIPRLVLVPEDTEGVAVGEYSADIQITMADGKRFTFWPRLDGSARRRERNYKNFVIMPEVTRP